MTDDIQSERFGESVAKESRSGNVLEALPVGTDSPYSPVGTGSPSSNQGTRTGCGCWVWGCAGLLIGGLLLMVGVGFGGYWFLTNQVEKYTDTEPDQIPAVEMQEEELARLQERIESFSRRVSPVDPDAEEEGLELPEVVEGDPDEGDDSDAPLELVLTANEINALIHSNESLQGMVHVVIEDGTIQGKVSIPMDQVPGGKGRYFNADAELDVSMENGILIVKLVDATVKGESLPEAMMGPIREQNFATEAYDDPQSAEILRRFESIEVIDDAIHLRLRQEEDAEEDGAAEGTSDAPDNASEQSARDSGASAEAAEAAEAAEVDALPEEVPVEAPLPF